MHRRRGRRHALCEAHSRHLSPDGGRDLQPLLRSVGDVIGTAAATGWCSSSVSAPACLTWVAWTDGGGGLSVIRQGSDGARLRPPLTATARGRRRVEHPDLHHAGGSRSPTRDAASGRRGSFDLDEGGRSNPGSAAPDGMLARRTPWAGRPAVGRRDDRAGTVSTSPRTGPLTICPTSTSRRKIGGLLSSRGRSWGQLPDPPGSARRRIGGLRRPSVTRGVARRRAATHPRDGRIASSRATAGESPWTMVRRWRR